jgi:hypothetical protein
MAHRELLATFCPEWIDDGMVARVTSGESLWVAAEVWRAAGWRSERQERLQEAENAYLRALDIARRQSAGSWELRAAMSLARLWARQGQPHRGISLLDAMAEAGPLEGAGVRDLREQLVHADTHSRPVSLCERRRRRDSGRQG